MSPNRFIQRAEWIWRARRLEDLKFSAASPLVEAEKNRYVYFRKTVDLERKPTSAKVHVSADGRYQLFVNGQFVGRGPARCSPEWQVLDPYDLRPFLRPGQNVIGALVHSYGRNTSWYELPQWEAARAFGCGGFFLQGEILTTATTVVLDTDNSWRHREAEAWQRDVPSGSLGFIEIYDARKAPQDWADVGFDDTRWQTAEVLRVRGRNTNADVVPFPMMVERDIPPLSEELRPPVRLLTVGEVENTAQQDIAACFKEEVLRPPAQTRVRNVQALLEREGGTEMTTTSQHSVSFVLDFGEIVSGRIRLELEASESGAVIDFTCGDRLLDDGRVKMLSGIPGFDVEYAHRYISRKGKQSWEQFEWYGFRYVQMTVRNCENPLKLHGVTVNFTAYPVERRGRFECSDQLLTRLWRSGAKTVSLAMHDAYDDCPTREQRQWVGDGYVQMLVNFCAFGDTKLAARFLRQIAQSQQPDGLLMMMAPGDFSRSRFTNIPDFCLYWILSLHHYTLYSGDTTVLQDVFPALIKVIVWFEQFIDDDHLLSDIPHWVFIDWAELDKVGQVAALNAHFVAALRAAAVCAQRLGYEKDARRNQALAHSVADAINRLFWDEARGVYVDARHKGKQSRRVSQQTNAAVIAFDVAPAERWPAMFHYILDEKRLVLTRAWDLETGDVPFDEEQNVVMAQPFYCHHLHAALSKAGRTDAMLQNVRKWQVMLEDGNTTFWETWQLHEISSKCHGWSATPTFDLSTCVLGIRPTAPGFTTFRVAPQVGDLQWAAGVFPTPAGDIGVAWQRQPDGFDVTIEVPEQTEGEFHPPVFPGKRLASLTCDGESSTPGKVSLEAGCHKVTIRYK